MSKQGLTPASPQILFYQTEDGHTRIACRLEEDTLWLTQAQIAELFQTTVANINIHLKAIYAEGELTQGATIKEGLIVRQEGKRQVSRQVKHYTLDAILAIGYRVRSHRGTQFGRRPRNSPCQPPSPALPSPNPMAHHKRKRPKSARAGCLLCKPHKMNGLGSSLQSRPTADRRILQEPMRDLENEQQNLEVTHGFA